MLTTAAAPAAPWRLRPGVRPVLAVLAFWTLVAVMAALADYSDQMRTGAPASMADKLKLYACVFTPFSLFSAALALAFARHPGLLQPRRLGKLYAGALLLFLPIYEVYEMAAVLWLAGQPLSGPVDLFLQTPAMGRWLDTLMLTMAIAVQAVWAWWQHSRDEAGAARLAERGNLAMRLSLLQGQLEPAFLLSSLDGIAELVRHAERSQATRALARLSELLRHALRASEQDAISIAEELDFLRAYVELQALRFGERVQVEWQLGEADWHGAMCPPLLLHALLDHAIARCLETGAAAGAVQLAFARAGGQVCVTVSHPQGGGPVDPGQALDETRERLALVYGRAASLHYRVAGERVEGVLCFPSGEGAHD
jgi:two-component system, LytTR family, sensor histidine kinase AlgZ